MIAYEQARQHAEFSRIPEHVLAGVYAFVEHRSQPGHFLTCVLTNDLFGAVGRADSESGAALRELVCFIHAEVPTTCYGTSAKVREWLFPRPKIAWTLPMLKRFKVAYRQTVDAKADTFIFDDNEFVVSYAAYLIEYLESDEVQAKLRA